MPFISKAEKAKWLERARIKRGKLDDGRNCISGTDLNVLAGLPRNAVWSESYFS